MYFWGQKLTLQGAGRGWVGVLPSSNLGLVGRGKADVEELGERFRLRRRMRVLPLLLLPEPTVETITTMQPS